MITVFLNNNNNTTIAAINDGDGFCRLEALERKREFEVMNKRGGLSLSSGGGNEENKNVRVLANPLEPSILLSALGANSSNSSSSQSHFWYGSWSHYEWRPD
jgi:hypothetical protein